MAIHETAASGYGAAASTYERGRPTYAPDAFRWVAVALSRPRDSSRALDVGAGTGKWTRGLAEVVADVTAVEPVAAMRAVLGQEVPSARVVAGTAEALPLAGGSVDLTTAASAVHWFRLDRAIPELCRVTRPGGVVAVAANVRDDGVAWVADLDRLLQPHRSGVPAARTVPWREAMVAAPQLEPLGEERFANPQDLDAERLATRVASLSFVAALPAPRREALLDEVRRFAAGLPRRFTMPYTTVVTLHRRRPDPTK